MKAILIVVAVLLTGCAATKKPWPFTPAPRLSGGAINTNDLLLNELMFTNDLLLLEALRRR